MQRLNTCTSPLQVWMQQAAPHSCQAGCWHSLTQPILFMKSNIPHICPVRVGVITWPVVGRAYHTPSRDGILAGRQTGLR